MGRPTRSEVREKLEDLDYVHGLITQALWLIDRLVVPDDRDEATLAHWERRQDEIGHELSLAHVEWTYKRYREPEFVIKAKPRVAGDSTFYQENHLAQAKLYRRVLGEEE